MCKLCDPRSTRAVPVTPAIQAAADAVRSLYDEHAAGGLAHIVTDDLNIDDADIGHCLQICDEPEEYIADGWEVAAGLVELSRAALLALQPLTRLERVKAIHEGRHFSEA